MRAYITIAAVVLAALAWLRFSKVEIFNSDKHFAVDQAEALTRIELSSGEGRIVLSKSNEQWYIYDAPANPEAVKRLLRVLTEIDVEYPMPKVHENSFSEISREAGGLHLLLYEGEDCIRNYHLMFTEAPGCIGLLDGKKQVYCLKVTGMDDQSVEASLSAEPEYWLQNLLFDLHPDEIVSISLFNNERKEESFTMACSDTSATVTDHSGIRRPIDREVAGRYFSYFMNVSFVRYINPADLSEEEQQGLMQTEPSHILTVETRTGKQTYKARYIPEPDRTDEYGNPLIYNRDSFYLSLPDGKLVKAKWITFDILFKKPT